MAEKNKKQLGVKSTGSFKLKHQPGKDAVRINLLDTFGFVPEDIIIHLASQSGSRIVLSAVLTSEEEKKRDAEMKIMADRARTAKMVKESKKTDR